MASPSPVIFARVLSFKHSKDMNKMQLNAMKYCKGCSMNPLNSFHVVPVCLILSAVGKFIEKLTDTSLQNIVLHEV